MSTTSARMGTSSSNMSSNLPVEKIAGQTGTIRKLRDIYSKFHFRCLKCKDHFPSQEIKSNVEAWFTPPEDHPPASLCLSVIKCTKCLGLTCMGCGRKPSRIKAKVSATSASPLTNCCERGRLLGVWLALCRFDNDELELQVQASKVREEQPKTTKHADDKGVGYDIRYEWEEYPMSHPTLAPKPINTKAIECDETLDEQIMQTLELIRRQLQTPVRASASRTQDELVLFRASLLLDRVCALIRNDSISDLTQRSGLYYSLFLFLEVIADDLQLAQILFEPQPSRKASPGLQALSDSSSHCQYDFNINIDQSASIFQCFNHTYKQACVFLDISKKIKKSKSKLGSTSDPTDMCKTIVKLYSVLEKMEKVISDPCFIQDMKHPWTVFSEKNCVTFTDDVLKNHRYAKSFPSLRHSSRDRMLTVGREISNMTTSLPAGVFVKVAESRADVMKVLIIGVEGSPYAGGIFIFDLLLPQNYPNSPPKMAFVLEGVDSELPSMNPNLHPGGSVCLSILNTWGGDESQMWQPGKSTILAVLVSIQAMILGAPVPWLNEPGLEAHGESAQAIEHKLMIQIKTIKYAMIAWLMKIKPADGKVEPDVWNDIVEAYWKYNSKSVLQTVEQWSLENLHIKSYHKATLQDMGMWAEGDSESELTPHIKIAPKGKTENLALKLQELVLFEPNKRVVPTEQESLSRESDDGSWTGIKGLSLGEVPIEGTSISKTGDKVSQEIVGEESRNGKRKESDAPEESQKDQNQKGGSKRQKTTKAKKDDANTSSFENGMGDAQPHGKSKQYLDGYQGASQSKDDELAGKWIYTGGRSIKEIRAVFQEFDLTPARSIDNSIARLEDYVNNGCEANNDLVLKHGKRVNHRGPGV